MKNILVSIICISATFFSCESKKEVKQPKKEKTSRVDSIKKDLEWEVYRWHPSEKNTKDGNVGPLTKANP